MFTAALLAVLCFGCIIAAIELAGADWPWRGPRTNPEIVDRVVVFPAPLLPSSATISPSPTLSDNPRSACTCP